MKKEILRLSQRYQRELRKCIRSESISPRRPEGLGREAVKDGLETLELASIHGKALLALMPTDESASRRAAIVRLANSFFLEAITPIENTHKASIENITLLKKAIHSLQQRTGQLHSSNQKLKKEVSKRKSAQRSLQLSDKNHRMLLKDARRMQQRLRHLSHQVLSAQEAERKEISRELHDEIVQTLTGINVQLASLKIESGVSKRSFSKHISYTQRLVEKSVNIVHQFARDLRPTLLDDLGLIPAMHAYMKVFTQRTGLHVNFSTFAGVERLSNDKRTVLYRVSQAALVNISQHAQATNVSVVIKEMRNSVLMLVKDDGRSFDVDRVLDSRKNKRLGLIGMRERVEMVGGTFGVESAPGAGTTISATIPFKFGGN